MALVLAPQFTQRIYSWTNWKTQFSTKGGIPQYDDDGYIYTIYFYDGPEVFYCNIWKSEVPDGIINGGYSQSQNDSDKSDFESNFKPFFNRSLVPKAQVNLGYTTSSGNVLTVIRATAYTEQTTNAQRSVLSSSTSDTSAGVGARTIKITYYDQNLLGPFTETVTLNGTSSVNTAATNICFIEKIEVVTVGSSLSNVGTITLKAATAGGGATIGTIAAGDGTTWWCHHYVGSNKVMQLISVDVSIHGSASGYIEVHRTVPTTTGIQELVVTPRLRIDAGDADKLSFGVPILINGPALVSVYGRSDASSGLLDWSAGMGYYEG